MEPDLLKLNLKLSDRKEELMNSTVGFNEVLADDEVYWPVDLKIEGHVAPVVVVKGRGFANHLPLFQVYDVVTFIYG